MKKLLTILSIWVCFPLAMLSQNQASQEPSWTHWYNQIAFKVPAGYSYSSLKKDLYLNSINKDGRPREVGVIPFKGFVQSKDKDFIAFIAPDYNYSKDGTYVCFPLDPDAKALKINKVHLDAIQNDFLYNKYGRDSFLSGRHLDGLPLTYRSAEYAKQAFNADTVITYPLQVWKSYKGKYNHCEVVMIQKNGRSFVQLFCLYTDKVVSRLDSYMKQLEGMIWYREPKDYVTVKAPVLKDSVIVVKAKKRKQKTITG